MVKTKTVLSWNFPELGYEENNTNDITKLYCKICKTYYANKDDNTLRGTAGARIKSWTEGTDVVKKNNFSDHLKSNFHKTAVLGLRSSSITNPLTANDGESAHQNAIAVASASSIAQSQSNIVSLVQVVNARQREQLRKKFQLAFFIADNNLSLKQYEKFGKFEKDVHKVDIGKGYLTSLAGKEILKYLSKVAVQENISNPLNSGERRYFSVLFDGSSSATLVDEKEVYVLKTCKDGRPSYNVIALEEPEEASAEGLKCSLDNALAKGNFTFDRRDHEIGLGSDGTSTNVKLYRLEKAEIGDHLLQVLCPSHKVELAVKDAFKNCELAVACDKDMANVYYLFKKAPLKWRLFKRLGIFLERTCYRFKRIGGTRWVEHQASALNVYLKNYPLVLAFCDQEISHPHNTSMKKESARLKGIRDDLANINRLVFIAIKKDVISYIAPCSLILQREDLLLPETIMSIETLICTISKLQNHVREVGEDVFRNKSLFPTINTLVLPYITEEEGVITLHRVTRANIEAEDNDILLTESYHSYVMRGSLTSSMTQAKKEFLEILDKLEKSLKARMEEIIENPIFVAAATILDTKSYRFKTAQEIMNSVKVVADHFMHPLKANGCDLLKLGMEMETLHSYVLKFCSPGNPTKTWQQVFTSNQHNLNNIKHIVEISIVLPISNAEVERVFSSFTRIVRKDRLSNKNDTLEMLMQLRGCSFTDDAYDKAIDLFLCTYPNGEVRKRPRRPAGYNTKKKGQGVPTKEVGLFMSSESSKDDDGARSSVSTLLSDINMDEISDDDWTDDSSDSD